MTKNKLVIAATLVLLLAIGLNAIESIRAYNRAYNVGTQNCEEIEVVKTAVRETIEASRAFVQSSHVRSKAEKEASAKYYKDVLARFKERDCGTKFIVPKSKGPHHAGTVRQETHQK